MGASSLMHPLLACFYCGVDSTPLVVFLVGLIGSLVLGTCCIGLSLVMTGKFKNPEEIKYEIFEMEKRV